MRALKNRLDALAARVMPRPRYDLSILSQTELTDRERLLAIATDDGTRKADFTTLNDADLKTLRDIYWKLEQHAMRREAG